jgi:hypothetical protein
MKMLLRVIKFVCGRKNAIDMSDKLTLFFSSCGKESNGRDNFQNGYFREGLLANRAVQTVKDTEKLAAY